LNIKNVTLLRIPCILILLLLSLPVYFGCSSDNQIQESKNNSQPVKNNIDEYGLNTDSLKRIEAKVKKNETLADILLSYNVPYKKIDEIAARSKKIFDVRKIQANKKYLVYLKPDSMQTIEYLIYEKNPVDFVKFYLGDSLDITAGSKKVIVKTNEDSGVINSSLYLTLSQQKLSPALAIKLADVFAWQIDFYTIQKGDRFKVIYERKFVGNNFVGVGDILAAEFDHIKNKYFAFRFSEDGKKEYFDESGNSLQKAFLKAPLKYRRISSRFSYHRFHPILRIYRPHLGIDYAAAVGTPVQAVGDGIVVQAKYKGQAGRFVKIKHNSVYSSGYLHLSRYGKGIKPGVKVHQGQVIGYVGRTGLATGPHLDFRFWKNGRLVNYLTQNFPPSRPVKKENMNKFIALKDSLFNRLETIKFDSTSYGGNLSASK